MLSEDPLPWGRSPHPSRSTAQRWNSKNTLLKLQKPKVMPGATYCMMTGSVQKSKSTETETESREVAARGRGGGPGE